MSPAARWGELARHTRTDDFDDEEEEYTQLRLAGRFMLRLPPLLCVTPVLFV